MTEDTEVKVGIRRDVEGEPDDHVEVAPSKDEPSVEQPDDEDDDEPKDDDKPDEGGES